MKRLTKFLATFAILTGRFAANGCRNNDAVEQSPQVEKKTGFAQIEREKLAFEVVMLANVVDDKKAIEDAKKYFEEPANRADNRGQGR